MPDRIKPDVDWQANHIDVNVPRQEIELSGVSTKRFHYILNLYNNQISSDIIKSISDGLIMPKTDTRNDFLSFKTLNVMKEIPVSTLSPDDPLGHMNKMLNSQYSQDYEQRKTKKEAVKTPYLGSRMVR